MPGLDVLTDGGLPRGRTTLIVGGPGSGKTILALQVLVEGARRAHEPGIFVAFEERSREIVKHAGGFGWDLPRLQKDRLFFLDARLDSATVQAGAFDLAGLLAGLSAKTRQIGARRIVFDGIDMLLAQLDDPAAERLELLRLHQWLGESGLSGIITAKTEQADLGLSPRYGFLQYLADCVVLLQHRLVNNVASRYLQIFKYRGGKASCNEVPMVITVHGVEVAGFAADTLDHKVSRERVSSGVPDLDAMLDGGYFRGTSILISGAPGTAKSILAGAFADAACCRRENTLFVSFDEGSAQIVRNLSSVGIRLDRHLKSGRLRMYSAHAGARPAEEHLLQIRSLLEAHRSRCLVIDPLSALTNNAGPAQPRGQLDRFMALERRLNITTVLTSLLEGFDGLREASSASVSTIADSWIHLSYVIQGGERNRGLTIIKSRGMAHSNQVRELLLSKRGLHLTDVYTAAGAVLMGTLRMEREEQERAARLKVGRALEEKQRLTEESVADLTGRMEALRQERDGRDQDLKRMREERAGDVGTGATHAGEVRRMRRGRVPKANDPARPARRKP
ncbi:MAG: circadian clock protein KaiC [Thermoanaerobaculia bacterium]|nr:circadian clock protein KaiC [Thermoanaerobaculia bacterium]